VTDINDLEARRQTDEKKASVAGRTAGLASLVGLKKRLRGEPEEPSESIHKTGKIFKDRLHDVTEGQQ
jgi:hypothetical protein